MAVADIIIAPANLYRAPVGEVLPDEDTIGFGTAWGGGWVNMGYTLTPVSLAWNQEIFKLEVEQLTAAVKTLRVGEEGMIETTLAELTAANMNLLMDGVVTTTAAGAAVRGSEILRAGGKVSITEYAWGIEGLFKVDGTIKLPYRVFFYKGTAILNGQLQFGKRVAAGLPIQITAIPDDTKTAGEQMIEIQKITAKNTVEA